MCRAKMLRLILENVYNYNQQFLTRLKKNVPVEASDCVRIDWVCSLEGEELESESAQDIDIDLMSKDLHPNLVCGDPIGMQCWRNEVD